MLAVVESAGLTAVPYGREWQDLLGDQDFIRMMENPMQSLRQAVDYVAHVHEERLKVGAARHFLASNAESLVADLRSILSPQFVARARDVAALMTKATESVARAADLLEEAVRR
jgi:hypothetical protein